MLCFFVYKNPILFLSHICISYIFTKAFICLKQNKLSHNEKIRCVRESNGLIVFKSKRLRGGSYAPTRIDD